MSSAISYYFYFYFAGLGSGEIAGTNEKKKEGIRTLVPEQDCVCGMEK